MLDAAISRQRLYLAKRFENESTVSGNAIVGLMDSQNIGYGDIGKELIVELTLISRLIDNLLDDEKICYDVLIEEVSEASKIEELRDFICKLPIHLRSDFIEAGKAAINTMHIYNSDNSQLNREREGEALAAMYFCILDKKTLDNRKISFFVALFISSYMFCDLKDCLGDKRTLIDIFKTVKSLSVNFIKIVIYSKNKTKTALSLLKVTIKSIQSSMSEEK